MNFKTTVILLVLLLAVGAYIVLTRDTGPATLTDTVQAKKLINISSQDMQSLTVMPADGKAFTFSRAGLMEWRITSPINSPAESGMVQALADEIANLISQRTTEISDGSGLKSPRSVVTVATRDGKSTTLNVGDKSGIGDQLYVQLKGNDKADIVAAGLEEQLDKPLDDFRRKALVTLGAPEVKYVSIDQPGGKIEMVKDGETWRMISPTAMPADSAEVGDLVVMIVGLHAEEFVEGTTASPLYGLNVGAKTITISTSVPVQPTTLPSSPTTQPAPIQIILGRPDNVLAKNVYATVAGSNAVIKLSKASLAFLDRKPLEYRDKQVLSIEPESVNNLTVTIDRPATTHPTTKPAEKKSLAVVRRPPPATRQTTQASTQPSTQPAPSTWMTAGDKPTNANDSAVDGILAVLHPLHAAKYVESAPTGGTTINVTVDTGGGGVRVATKTEFQITDPGDGKPAIGTYNGLHFQVERTLLEKLEADFTQPGPPAPAKPLAGPPTGPEMDPQIMP